MEYSIVATLKLKRLIAVVTAIARADSVVADRYCFVVTALIMTRDNHSTNDVVNMKSVIHDTRKFNFLNVSPC